jgi:hypothetical protein
MIYSVGLDRVEISFTPSYWKENKFKKLTSFNNDDPDPIFYLDRHDMHQRGVLFPEFIQEEHWALVRSKKAKILIDYSDDYLNARDIVTIAQTLKNKNIPSEQVYMLVMDPLWQAFVTRHFKDYDLNNVTIGLVPWLLHRAVLNGIQGIPSVEARKFSVLSRNYRPWRLELMLNLLAQGALDKDTAYSFHNIEPYENKVFSKQEMLADAQELKGSNLNTAELEWIDQIPYDIGKSNDKFFNGTYSVIMHSGVHILIESHWDPYQTASTRLTESNNFGPNEWAPAFATEKFYKSVFCQVPFIIASTPGFLREIKEMGYKTFSPFINESYDEIIDDRARSKAIAQEVARLNALPPEHFWTGVRKLRKVLAHNLAVMNEQRDHNPFMKMQFLYEHLNHQQIPVRWLIV